MANDKISLDRIDNPTREVLDNYIAQSRPCVITGVVKTWHAFTAWRDPQYLLHKAGAQTIIPLRTDFRSVDDPHYGDEWLGKTVNKSFGEFLQHWLSVQSQTEEASSRIDGYYYLASLPMNVYFPALMEDVIPPPHAQEQNKSGNLWIGNRGQVTPVHHDWSAGDQGMDGLHAVVYGTKRFRLFDPEINAKCFRRRREWGKFHQSLIDVENPDLNKHPEFRNATCIDIVLSAGEMLFIPKLWWHHVRTLEPSISVNFWFQHLASEKLKLTKHWSHMEQFLEAVANMKISPEKMKKVLQYYLDKNSVSDDEIQFYMQNPLQFMLLPKFLRSFGNVAKYPLLASPEAKHFATTIEAKVRAWVLQQLKRTSQPPRNSDGNGRSDLSCGVSMK